MGSIKARTHKGTYSYEGDEDGGATTTRVKQLAYTKTSSGTNFEALTYTYTYDERGNITEIADPISGTRHYEYDALGQMVEERIGDTVYSYGYDNAGNLTSYCGNALQYTDGDWKDLATSYRTWTHYHDEMGNPTSYHNGTRWNFQWNGRQLTQAKKSGTELPIDYVYDENGLRITKSVASADGTTVHTYLYDNSGALIRETRDYPDGTQDIMEFLYDQSGRPYAFVLNNVTYYYVLNLQGDIVRLVNTAGTTVVSYVYNAWGKILSTQTTSLSYSATVAAKNPLRYRGYYFDTETQLYYCQSRYYDPATGRFLNADALTSTGQGILGNNMFAYCGNNPICYADNSGYRMEYIDAEMVAGGIPYILDQKDDSVATKQFGLATVLHGGCGVIASYNALITLGDPKSFDDVLGYYNSRMGFTLGAGLTGLYPNSVAKYFYSLGYEVIVTDQKSRLDELSQTADASIMYYEYPRTYWLFPAYGAHFVEYHRSNHIYEGVNTNGLNGRSYFSTPSDYGYSGSRYYVVGIFIYK